MAVYLVDKEKLKKRVAKGDKKAKETYNTTLLSPKKSPFTKKEPFHQKRAICN